jgi:hypothetical protein
MTRAENCAEAGALYTYYMLYNFGDKKLVSNIAPHLDHPGVVYHFHTHQAVVFPFSDGSAIIDTTPGPWEFRAYGCHHACLASSGCRCDVGLITAVVNDDNIIWGVGNTTPEALADAVENGLEPEERISILAAEADLREVVQTLGGSETAWWYRDVTPTKTVLRLRRNQPLPT